jgi:hypothetical protein
MVIAIWLSDCNVSSILKYHVSRLSCVSKNRHFAGGSRAPKTAERSRGLIPVYVLLCVQRMPPGGVALALQAGEGLFLLGVFTALPTPHSVRPGGDASSGWMLALSFLAGTALQTFSLHNEALELRLVRPSKLWQTVAVVCKGLWLFVIGSVTDTSQYHFMLDQQNTKGP